MCKDAFLCEMDLMYKTDDWNNWTIVGKHKKTLIWNSREIMLHTSICLDKNNSHVEGTHWHVNLRLGACLCAMRHITMCHALCCKSMCIRCILCIKDIPLCTIEEI